MREKYYKVEVWGIALDPINKSPVVILRNTENPKELMPIWIGGPEANGIIMVLNNIEFERPLTYELLTNILKTLNAVVSKVVINDLKEGTFFARIYLIGNDGKIYEIDSRPSDAINIALRTKAPIFVKNEIFDSSKISLDQIIPFQEQEEKKEEKETKEEKAKETETKEEFPQDEIKKWLENLKPEDFLKHRKHKEGHN